MQIEIPEQDKLTSQLLNNIGIAIGAESGGEALPTAVAMIRRAMRLNPLDAGRMLNLASVLLRTGEDDEAERLVTTVLKRDQNLWLAWQILGFIRTMSGDLDEATDCFRRAYDIDPASGQRAFDLASAYMRAGDFARGLPLYERRHEILPRTSPPPPCPEWKGEKVRHLCVWADQGHGDRIMFARFLLWARERADKVTLLTDPASVTLLFGYSAICDLACGWNDDSEFDAQVSLGSLPLLYGMTAQNIPPDPGLLSVASTAGTLGAPGLKIGIVWFGNPAFPGNDMRTVPFPELLPLAADPRNSVFSLQVGARSGDIARYRAQRLIHDMSGQIEGDWSHTAAVIKNLDLVVTSCTAVAHLAGALKVPNFVLLPRFGDWRWLHGRDDTPWYPRTRLFRQTKVGRWDDVVARVVKAIEMLHARQEIGMMLTRNHAAQVAQEKAVYEPDVAAVLRRVLRKGDTFVDVGANIGKHTVDAAKLVGEEGRVIAFEPGANCLPALREATKDLPQVKIIDKPAWNHAGEVTFFLNADNSGGNALWDPAEWPGPHNPKSKEHPNPVTMTATRLDDVINVEQGYFGPVRLLKIDTEGAEQRVLEGAEQLFHRLGVNRPHFVIAELHEFGLDKLGCSQASLRGFMESRGYSTFVPFADGSTPMLVPPGTRLKSGYIVNLLFAKPEDVGALWSETEVTIPSLRPFWGWGEPLEQTSAA